MSASFSCFYMDGSNQAFKSHRTRLCWFKLTHPNIWDRGCPIMLIGMLGQWWDGPVLTLGLVPHPAALRDIPSRFEIMDFKLKVLGCCFVVQYHSLLFNIITVSNHNNCHYHEVFVPTIFCWIYESIFTSCPRFGNFLFNQ